MEPSYAISAHSNRCARRDAYDSLTRPELSERELQVLKHMAAGKSNKEIAQIIYVSENTVKAHVKSILAKMDAMGRTEAIAIALKRGLIEAP